MTFSQGTNIGWFSPALPVLSSDHSPLLDGPISQATAGWIGSFLALGAIFGGLGFGLFANWIGYKRSLQLSTIPLFVSLQKLSNNSNNANKSSDLCADFMAIYHIWRVCMANLHVAVLSWINGWSCFYVHSAIRCRDLVWQVIIKVWAKSLAKFLLLNVHTFSVRGQLNSYIQIACYSGILVGFIGGSYLPYAVNPIVMIAFSVVFFIGFYSMPESPQFLLKTNRFEVSSLWVI